MQLANVVCIMCNPGYVSYAQYDCSHMCADYNL